jgi:hypothetical protein
MEYTRLIPYRIGKNWFIYDRTYETIISKELDYANFLDKKLESSKSIIIYKNNRSAIISNVKQLKNVIWYEEIKPLHIGSNMYLVYDSFKWSIVDSFGELLTKNRFDRIIYKGLYPHKKTLIKQGDKFGVLDLDSFEIIFECKYDKVIYNESNVGELILTLFKGTKILHYHCPSKDFIQLPNFDKIEWSNHNVCCLRNNNKYFLYNFRTNALVKKLSFDSADVFNDGYSICSKGENLMAVYGTGESKQLAKGGEPINILRLGNQLIVTYRKTNIKKKNFDYYFIYFENLKSKFLLLHNDTKYCHATFEENEIHIKQDSKYGSFTINRYNLDGELLDELSRKTKTSEGSQKTIELTNISGYHIAENKLHFNKKIIYDKHTGELNITRICDLILLEAIIDVDPEFGVYSETIGYLDIHGLNFWKDIFPKCFGCGLSNYIVADYGEHLCQKCNFRIDQDGKFISYNGTTCSMCGNFKELKELKNSYWCSTCNDEISKYGDCISEKCLVCNDSEEMSDEEGDESDMLVLPDCKMCGDNNDVIEVNENYYKCAHCDIVLKFNV